MDSEQNNSEIHSANSATQNLEILEKNIKSYSHNDKKLLVKRITDIKNKRCYIKIFKIIHTDNYKYTKNDNGIFFNLTNLSDEILTKIELVIKYYENKKIQTELQLIQNLNSSPFNYINNDDSINSDILNYSDKKINNLSNTHAK